MSLSNIWENETGLITQKRIALKIKSLRMATYNVDVKINSGETITVKNLNSEQLKEFHSRIWVSGVKKEIEKGVMWEWISPLRICEVIATKNKN